MSDQSTSGGGGGKGGEGEGNTISNPGHSFHGALNRFSQRMSQRLSRSRTRREEKERKKSESKGGDETPGPNDNGNNNNPTGSGGGGGDKDRDEETNPDSDGKETPRAGGARPHGRRCSCCEDDINNLQATTGQHGTQLADHNRRLNVHSERCNDADTRIDRHKDALAAQDRTLGGVDRRIVAIDTALDDHDTTLDGHEERLGAGDQRLDQHVRRIQVVEGSVQAHDTQLQDHARHIQAHRRRIDGYEEQLQNHDNALTAHRNRLTNHDGQLGNLTQGLAAQVTQHGELATRTQDLTDQVQAQTQNTEQGELIEVAREETARLHGKGILADAERDQARQDIAELTLRAEGHTQRLAGHADQLTEHTQRLDAQTTRMDYHQEWIQETRRRWHVGPPLQEPQALPHRSLFQRARQRLRDVWEAFFFVIFCLVVFCGLQAIGGPVAKVAFSLLYYKYGPFYCGGFLAIVVLVVVWGVRSAARMVWRW